MSDLSGLTSNQLRAHLALERPKKSLLYRLFKCAVVVSAGFFALTGIPSTINAPVLITKLRPPARSPGRMGSGNNRKSMFKEEYDV